MSAEKLRITKHEKKAREQKSPYNARLKMEQMNCERSGKITPTSAATPQTSHSIYFKLSVNFMRNSYLFSGACSANPTFHKRSEPNISTYNLLVHQLFERLILNNVNSVKAKRSLFFTRTSFSVKMSLSRESLFDFELSVSLLKIYDAQMAQMVL